MLLVNTEHIPGHDYEVLGLVRGSTIQTKHLGHDLTQSLKTLVGGELQAYTDMMNQARELATERMTGEAIDAECAKAEKKGREWQEPYLRSAMLEAGELIRVAMRRKGFEE